MADPTRQNHATTAQIVAAANIHQTTTGRWVRLGLLPTPTDRNNGRRGRTRWWPPHAPEQAVWVKAQLDLGRSHAEVRESLARGEFVPGKEARDA